MCRLPVSSSLVTGSSALQDGCQLRQDIALTDRKQLTLTPLSREWFAASV